ncbi:sigma-54 dependent transcriptional regulator [Kangiella sp. TOML190]|uniref:sigma-54-dependent transcriptional regulator n=1 Tax=Kangiella sp. TOML190 TaxID=2931351 RepID=UPI002040EE53|nr:sigma-54 dependent transcriptional regulator [Kangiella sp. TOML190]
MKLPVNEPKVLVIDDEADIRHLLTMSLIQLNIEVDNAKDVAEAMSKLQTNEYHFCITDMKLPDGNGLDIVKHCHTTISHMPIAVITAFGNTDTAVEAMKLGAFDFLAKPIELVQLRQLIKNAFNYNKEQEPKEKYHSIELLNGKSDSIKELHAQLDRVDQSNAPVVVQGAKGTEKEKIANLIHSRSSRSEFKAISLDCSTQDAETIESLLFDDTADRESLLEQANNSSLIISNIHQLNKNTQRKLLQVIESKTFEDENTQEMTVIDARIIICTELPLEKYVANLSLREDLYFRLNILNAKIPNLEQRSEDIDLLIDIYSSKLSPDHQISPQAKKELLSYKFPYNYRELENLIRKAAASDNKTVNSFQLDTSSNPVMIDEPSANPDEITLRGDMSLDEYIAAIERQEILKALEKTRWNRTEAAKLLGVSFRTIRYKIQKLDIK